MVTNVPTRPRSPSADRAPAGFAVCWEQLEWSGDAALAGAMSHRAQKKSKGPYRAAVPARIAAAPLSLPAAVTAAAEDALMEITRFDAELANALPTPRSWPARTA